MDPLLTVIVLLIVICVIVAFLPLDATAKAMIYKILGFVVCIVLLVWALGMFGLMPHGGAHLTK